MNVQAKMAFASAQRRLQYAAALHEDATTSGEHALFGLAYAEVLLAGGELAAALQMVELEEQVAHADTERPLRLVR